MFRVDIQINPEPPKESIQRNEAKNIQATGSSMGAETYQVIYKGEILPGFDKQAVFKMRRDSIRQGGHRRKDSEQQTRGVEEGWMKRRHAASACF
ncbi:MAG: hypothetical protein MZV70_76055 [Desulfobacterales bacterium]|nr:hypothetical protein [Desulfobacterales bacterium]